MIQILSTFERNEITQILEEPRKEELMKFFFLTEFDLINTNKYNYDSIRLGYAVQLCILRYKGWPLNYIKNIPESIIKFVAEQLKLDSNLFESYFTRKNTVFNHYKSIRMIYGYELFSDKSLDNLNCILDSLLEKSDNAYFLVFNCITSLKNSKIVLPGISKIEELVWEAKLKNESKILETINKCLTDVQRKKIDFLLEAEKDTNFTTLSWLRDNIGKPSTNTILEVIKKIDRIDNLKLKLNLNSIPSYKIEQFTRLGRRYEPFSLRRFEDKKDIP